MLQKRVVGLLGIRRGGVCASVYDGKAVVRPRPRPGRGEQIVELVIGHISTPGLRPLDLMVVGHCGKAYRKTS